MRTALPLHCAASSVRGYQHVRKRESVTVGIDRGRPIVLLYYRGGINARVCVLFNGMPRVRVVRLELDDCAVCGLANEWSRIDVHSTDPADKPITSWTGIGHHDIKAPLLHLHRRTSYARYHYCERAARADAWTPQGPGLMSRSSVRHQGLDPASGQ